MNSDSKEVYTGSKENIEAMSTLVDSLLDSAKRTLAPLTSKMYDKQSYPIVDTVLIKLEKTTNMKRENIIYGASLLMFVYVILGSATQIICNLAAYVYPAYRSIKAVRSATKDDDTNWLIYWIVFAWFSVVDLTVFSNFPFYWLIKVVFLMYLYLPAFKGANIIYERYIDPTCCLAERFFTAQPNTNGKKAD